MIAFIEGKIDTVGTTSVVINVGGVGYEVLTTPAILSELKQGDTRRLLTYDHITDSGRELFGFSHAGERDLFVKLLGVSGIGPKSALAVMGLGKDEQIRQAIANSDVTYIAQASGVGKRSAERICVELKDKVNVASTADLSSSPAADDAYQALMALGYSPSRVNRILSKLDRTLSTEELVKQALKEL